MISIQLKHTVLLSVLFSIKHKWAVSWNDSRCAYNDLCKIGKNLQNHSGLLAFPFPFLTKQVCLQQRPVPNDIERQKLTTTTTQRSIELAADGNFSLWLYQVTAISSQVPPSSPVVCTEVTEPSLCSVILLLCLLCSCTGNFPSAVSRFHSARTFCILLTGLLLWLTQMCYWNDVWVQQPHLVDRVWVFRWYQKLCFLQLSTIFSFCILSFLSPGIFLWFKFTSAELGSLWLGNAWLAASKP